VSFPFPTLLVSRSDAPLRQVILAIGPANFSAVSASSAQIRTAQHPSIRANTLQRVYCPWDTAPAFGAPRIHPSIKSRPSNHNMRPQRRQLPRSPIPGLRLNAEHFLRLSTDRLVVHCARALPFGLPLWPVRVPSWRIDGLGLSFCQDIRRGSGISHLSSFISTSQFTGSLPSQKVVPGTSRPSHGPLAVISRSSHDPSHRHLTAISRASHPSNDSPSRPLGAPWPSILSPAQRLALFAILHLRLSNSADRCSRPSSVLLSQTSCRSSR